MATDIPPCPVCGLAPVYTETAHHNHTFRCDGDLRDLALSPRHTIYVFSAHREEAASLWRKATSREALAAEPPSATAQGSPCACCDGAATHRSYDGAFRCDLHRLNGDKPTAQGYSDL